MTKFFSLLLAVILLFSVVTQVASADGGDALVNLSAGLSYVVTTGEEIAFSYAAYTEDGSSFDEDSGQLTDSQMALSDVKSDGWYKSFRGRSRIVDFDLGKACAVSEIRGGFLHMKTSAIYAPRYINVSLSEDGKEFELVKHYETGFSLASEETTRYDAAVLLDGRYAARFVRVEYCCDIFSYCDEISVYGTDAVDGSEIKLRPDTPAEDAGYPESLAGVSDIIKIYNGYFPRSPYRALNTEEELLPYVAYIDENGSIADTLFDAVAFVPCHGDYPSGGRLVKTNGKSGALMSDWELYYELTFGEGRDLEALDKTVEKVYKELGKTDKYKVFLTLPYPTVIDKPFGDINGDGKQEGCVTLAERLAILEWFADKCIKGFNDAGYANLTLAGFYWYREEVNRADSDDEAELLVKINAYLDKKTLVTLFDPFYLSIGFEEWSELGFDGAVMQPNLAFSEDRSYFSTEMLAEFAKSAKRHGLGTEIETDEPSYFEGDDYHKAGFNYESYLFYGAQTGYMNGLKTYYQGAGPGTFYDFCNADTNTPKGVYLRRLYDLTYAFVKESYSNAAPTVEIDDFEVVAGDSRVTVDIAIDDGDSFWGDVSVSFPQEPKHGQVAVAAGKRTLIYNADDDYAGTDSFTVLVSDGFNSSQEITVTVTVTEPKAPESKASEQESGLSGESESDGGSNGVRIILLICAIAAVAAVTVFFIVKRKKATR